MKTMPSLVRFTVMAPFLVIGLGACSTIEPVQPWEKGTLSRPEMTFEADVLDAKYTEHILFSKEGASGGAGVGGGGCGCN